ncbi:ribosomal protein S18-alanine N-acetyltransferase [candidate division TA06 bacterium]|nr:ribosomal protein S18-alanine N-acetyltransferase [candidate division TA06 bacterium]
MELKTKHHLTNTQSPITNLHIDDMEIRHLPSILQIEQSSFKTPWPTHVFLEDIRNENSITLVALTGIRNVEEGIRPPKADALRTPNSGNHVVGYAVAWLVFDELHIGNAAVEERFRRQGVGEKLLQELLERGEKRGVQLATLEVRISNDPAIRLYQKFGFKEIAIQKEYYKLESEDALVMLLQIG